MNAAWVCGSKELPLKADVLDEESNIYSFSSSEPVSYYYTQLRKYFLNVF